LCARPKAPSVRQKSCRQCSIAKSRCDLQRPSCSRCISRSSPCNYVVQAPGNNISERPKTGHPIAGVCDEPANPKSQTVLTQQQNTQFPLDPFLEINNTVLIDVPPQSLDHCEAICAGGYGSSSCGTDSLTTAVNTPDIPDLTNDWIIPLSTYSSHTDTTPLLAKHSMQVLLRLFRTWPRMVVKGFQLPPIFHQSITSSHKPLPQLLSNCFTLARMWDGQCDGASAMVQETVLKETKTIFSNVGPVTFVSCLPLCAANRY
jgi:hypothetical protein